jgi:hypothetical protein
VIGTFEEYIIMQVLGFNDRRSINQALIIAKPHAYDRLEVRGPGTEPPVSVYFNIDAFFPSHEF